MYMGRKYGLVINRIIDGDSMDVDIKLGFGVVLQNKRLRLEGVDTPELRTSDEEERKYGLRAKEFVVGWCEDKEVDLVMKNDDDYYDKFGRILGDICDKDGMSLVSAIIANYHGVAYQGQNKAAIRAAHMVNREKLA
jgi:micrococcal nuclease